MTRIKSILRIACMAALAAWIGPAAGAGACGAFFSSTTDTELADMSDQRVFMILSEEGRVDHLVQVLYNGKPTSFAWVYPFPGIPEIDEGDETVFSRLDETTKPRFYITTIYGEGDEGCGCPIPGSAADKEGGSADAYDEAGPPVTVWDTGQVGIFEYATISAVTIDDMLQWLVENGYRAPGGANEVLAHYVDLGWYFVAMKISPDTEAMTAKTSVLRFTYASASLVYPLHMTSISPAPTLGVTIYVAAHHRSETSGDFRTLEVPKSDVRATSSSTTNYEQVFRDVISGAGGRAFVAEYAGSGADNLLTEMGLLPAGETGFFLTRLRTIISPALLTSDVPITFAGSDDAMDSVFYLDYHTDAEDAGAGSLLLSLVCLLVLAILRAMPGRRPRE